MQTGYAQIGPLSMYHEIEGEGPPLVLLHGAYMTADMMAGLRAGLTGTRRVITPELQGHGRTADADRPLTHEQMAEDTAALLRHLGALPAERACTRWSCSACAAAARSATSRSCLMRAWPCCRARRTSSRRTRASWTGRRCSSR